MTTRVQMETIHSEGVTRLQTETINAEGPGIPGGIRSPMSSLPPIRKSSSSASEAFGRAARGATTPLSIRRTT